MAAKKITIVLLPDGANRVKQFRVPRFLPTLLIFLLIASISGFGWIVRDYREMKARMPRLTQLQKENEHQKRQFAHLNQRIQGINAKMGELEEFNQRLKNLVNAQTEEQDAPFQGVGGSEPSVSPPPFAAVETEQEAARLMEHSLGGPNRADFYKFLESQKILLASLPSMWPVKGWVSSGFGHRTSPFTGEKEMHRGIDLAAAMSAPVKATADGIVSSVDIDPGYGKIISIKHGYGIVTRYAHLEKCLVETGQYVKGGEIIARVGSSGRSNGPRLYYEVQLNGVAVNPLRYVPN